ncbi:MAG: T9SS type A sorting domain-containing protein, partial [Calditrichaeota bacterium]|nr:T9SS type A sorting domain-containing protein [Calditrichota bacterium]
MPPVEIISQGTVRFGFALIAGTSLEELVANARLAQQIWVEFGNEIVVYPVEGFETPAAVLPEAFALAQNYPNPFNPSTTIHYALKERTRATIVIYNLLGQRVRTLVNAVEGPGYREVIWDGR